MNARLLKAHYHRAVAELVRTRTKKQLGREERVALMEKTKLELMTKQSPSTSLYEMAWNLKTHHVYFSATSEKLSQEFCDLFSDTFHTGLTPLYPFLRAERKASKEGLKAELLETLPSIFSPLALKREAGEAREEPGNTE